MKVSVCITVYNEERSISKLVESLLRQSKKPDEIVIVDGGSGDKTVEIIRHFQKKDKRIKLLIEKCSRSRGRNLAVELAKNDIIAMTDAGCVPKRNWLENITEPFKHKEVDIVAGFYTMKVSDSLQKALSVFLGIHPKDFDINFLPSTRSVAFTKQAWEKISGFLENLEDTAEDTVFNYKALKLGLNISRMKNARVEWEMPKTFSDGIIKIYKYAKGDAKSRIWLYPSKGLASHNIKALSIFARYILGISFIFLYLFKLVVLLVPLILVILYILWSFRKVFLKTGDWIAGLWGILVQFTSDFAVMSGFLMGLRR